MKKFFHDNSYGIVIIGVFIILSVFFTFQFYQNHMNNKKMQDLYSELCSQEEYQATEMCQGFLENNKSTYISYDSLSAFREIMLDDSPLYLICDFGILLIAIVLLQKMKDVVLTKYDLIRESYHDYKKRMCKKIFQSVWLLPIITLIPMITSYIVTKNFDYSDVVSSGIATYDVYFLKMGASFFGIIELNTFLYSIISIFIILIAYRISKNKYITVILSTIMFIVLEVIFEGVIPYIFINIFHISIHSYFNLIDLFSFTDIPNILIYLLVKVVVSILLGIVVFLIYKNKESYYISVEKIEGAER